MANNRRWWIGGAIGLSLVAVIAFAEIMSPDAPLADPMAGSDTAASMVPAPNATFVAASVPDQTPVDLGAGLPAHDATVGKVAGTASVEGGAATYDIPIVLPPGRRGMQPELSLNYSSRSGNGIAGMGWSLSGISSITRCPSTLDQDGAIRGVRLDAADKLCLDGQRLLIKAGTYGVAGATYATEIDSFVRVTQLSGGLASAAANFKVETKSGEVLYYGQTANSRVTPGGGSYPVSWLLERKEDRVGNYLHYSYTDYGSGEVLLAYVTYTGFGTTDGDRRVELSYEARPTATGSNDTASTYLAGTVTRQTQRLKNIVTKVGTAFVRQWLLNYGTASSTTTGRSLLNSISDCGYNGSAWVCKPATTFTWQQGAPTYSLTAPAMGFDLGAALPSDLRPVGDFDGDGSNEVIVVRQDPSSGARQSYIVSMTPERAVRWTMAIPADYTGLYGQTMQDFNQDGRVDLIGRDASNNLVVRTWSGSPTDTNFATAFATTWSTGISAPVSGTISVGYVGDMDGDGRADIVMTGETGNGTTSCAKRITIYRNTPNAGNPQAAPTFPVLAQHCLASNTVSGITNYEKLDRVSDFDGDSLPDLFVRSGAIGLASNTALNRIVLGVKSGSYSLQSVAFSSVFTAADPATSTELSAGLYALWTDVNGDGLDDLVYARSSSGGKWTLRMNQGGSLGGRYEFTSGTGLQGCGSAGSQANCNSIWQPWRASKIQVTDVDGDGRNEILVPTSFAANICIHLVPDPNKCPYGDGTQPECFDRFACPEDPLTGLSVVGGANGASGQVLVDLDGNGTAETTYDTDRFQSAYANGIADLSAYYMTALRFVETSPGVISLREVPTSIVSNEGGAAADIYGDGQPDALFKLGIGGAGNAVGIPITRSDGTAISTTVSPRSLPNGLPIFSRNMLLNENRGAGGALNADGLTPQTPDLIAVVTDGLGGQVVWNYAPLAGEAGRVAGQTPLYTVPMVASQRYIDERHIYFTSSMQVVSEMSQSDGVGSFRTWLYGYGEAIYNTQGRGFQGFRTIIVEDEAAGTRTTTTYSQKFPLTSQPEQILVNSLHRSGTDGPISKQLFTWRCNRADRTDVTACSPQSGTPTVRFVYLDTQETDTYDAATADNPNGGTPALLGYTKTIASDNANCNEVFPATSGYDANGNLTQSITLSYDGTGTGGYRSFMTRRCVRELASYATADTVNWWLDKLNSKTSISSIAYNATNHALPTGTSNPTQTVATAYTWNTNRTIARETVQNGVANQQKATTYGYPATNNYGLPTSISIAASGDPNGSRGASTSYSSDGYFPQTVTNALSQSVTTLTRDADGQPSQVTDPNGLRTLFDYDPFGLPTLVRSRGPADAQYLAPDKQVRISRCTGTGCVANAVLFVRTIQDGTPIVTEEKDLNGHTLRAHRTLLDGTESLVDTRYDSAGRVTQQSEPYRSGTTAYWTVYAGYDVLGRVTGKSMPTSSGQTLTTIYTYTGRTTQIDVSAPAPTVPLSMSRTTDSLGRYVETIDASGGQTKYWYDAAGNALAIRDANGSVLQAAYNAIGQRTQAVDPNQGTWNFTYDALGEVLSQTDARQIVTNYQYDVLGRTTRTSASFDYDGVTGNETVQDDFTYDPANGKGLPAGNSRTLGSLVLRTEDLTYDTLARPISNRIVSKLPDNVTGVGVTQSTSYDTYYGRPKTQDAGNGESLWLQYSDYGDVLKETDPNSGVDYRIVQAVDARGTPIQEAWGNGMSVVRQTWAQTGQVKKIDYRSPGGASVRSFDLGYDAYGNLASQLLNGGTSSESFTYDPLQRLTQASRPIANGTVNYSYDAVGNLKSKSDFSTTATSAYGYTGGSCGGGPNAVKSVALAAGGSRTYCYDANGNMTSDSAGLAVRYDATQRPLRIARASVSELFDYAPDGSRFRESGTDGTLMTFGVLERRYTAPSSDKVYFANAVITKIGATRTVSYLLTDRQGGVDSVADGSGTLTETRGYDAFGKPRTGTWADASPPRLATINNTPHGFTGHEHLNSLELIHMNGRVYDYNLGRFMEVDPVIQAPLNSQSLNPYSYIMNNPLSGRDPTGYSCEAMTGTHICGNDTGAQGGITSKTENMTDASGGKIKISEYLASGGSRWTTISSSHNGAPRDSSARQNEKTPNEIGSATSRKNSTERNEGYDAERDKADYQKSTTRAERYYAALELYENRKELLDGHRFWTAQGALAAFVSLFVPITEWNGFEFGANIHGYQKNSYGLGEIVMGDEGNVGIPEGADPKTIVADVHSHPNWSSDGFSGWVVYNPKNDQVERGRGDLADNYLDQRVGYVVRGGDRSIWRYNHDDFVRAISNGKRGHYSVDAEDYVERISP